MSEYLASSGAQGRAVQSLQQIWVSVAQQTAWVRQYPHSGAGEGGACTQDGAMKSPSSRGHDSTGISTERIVLTSMGVWEF